MITGRTWMFGDNINTDLMMPGPALYLPKEERIRYIFQANRPDWIELMRPGDIILAGQNFGVGSSRPAALSLRDVEVACVIAESINGLFFRNAVSFGLPALECPGITKAFSEGDIAEVDLASAIVRNASSGRSVTGISVPEDLVALMLEGGILPRLEKQGLIRPLPSALEGVSDGTAANRS
jgi:3-isopropylmalate/(R)-2-methylmalate dehydratase small subunit